LETPGLKFDVNTELAARRTGMSFQRTRMSADRTLMSVIRTSLSLISFGFTIAQIFQKLREQNVITGAGSARRFGLALVVLGVAMLIGGIVYHAQYMLGLRRMRRSMAAEGLIHAESIFPASLTLITALLLLALGVVAIMSMAFHVGPFE
jgi:putative membrane protein